MGTVKGIERATFVALSSLKQFLISIGYLDRGLENL